ncbi:MAG: hypothetical protein J6T74_05950, partial [Clostridia bacterium]|nr:hypothetical protein [Clostridia bacterium]
MITILLQKILDLLKEKLGAIGSFISSFSINDPQDGQTLVYDSDTEKWVNADNDAGVTETKTGDIVHFNTSLALPLKKIETTDNATKVVQLSGDISSAEYFRGLFLGTYAFVDLSDLSYTTTSWGGYKITIEGCKPCNNSSVANVLSELYTTTSYNNQNTNKPSESISVASTGNVYVVSDNVPSGYLIYELATATTPTITDGEFETLCTAFNLNGDVYTLPITNNFNAFVGDNNIFSDNGEITIEYYNGMAKDIYDIANHTKDLTGNLTIDFLTIEQSSCNVKAYQEGHIVVVEINYMKYLTTPTDTGI